MQNSHRIVGMNVLQRESSRHSTAYAYFLQLGAKRSYPQVARQFSVSATSVKKWARSFHWEERVREADTKANAEQIGRATETYAQTIEDFRSLKYRTFADLQVRVDSGQCSIMELIQILRAVKLELGEPIHITAMPQQSQTRNPFEGIFKQFFGEKNATPEQQATTT